MSDKATIQISKELKGRYANYYTGDKSKVRLSLNAVKRNFGADIARALLKKKQFTFSDTLRLELELLPGEKSAEETAREALKIEIGRAK